VQSVPEDDRELVSRVVLHCGVVHDMARFLTQEYEASSSDRVWELKQERHRSIVAAHQAAMHADEALRVRL
jgi:hypothetical protein